MTTKQFTWYFEDFIPGSVIPLGQRTVTEEEIIHFAQQFDPQSFHVDKEAAKASIFGGVIASGWHTCSMIMHGGGRWFHCRFVEHGFTRVDEVRWILPAPRRYTDRQRRNRFSQTVIAPRRGVVNTSGRQSIRMVNVCTIKGMGMFGRRPQA
jgi:acyl dehydratase